MFERTATTLACVSLLRGVNGEITYTTICGQLKLPLETIRGSLSSARRALEKEHIAFGVIRGVGLYRLNDSETARSSSKFVRQINRTAGRGKRRLGAIADFDKLSNADQLEATLNRTLFETVRKHTRMGATAPKAEPAAVPNLIAIVNRK